jgi:hypothetical protein
MRSQTLFVVAMKPVNEGGRRSEELVEQWGGAKENAVERGMCRTRACQNFCVRDVHSVARTGQVISYPSVDLICKRLMRADGCSFV